jgi:hypothetical protein
LVTNYALKDINYKLRAINYTLKAINYKLRAINYTFFLLALQPIVGLYFEAL